MRNIHQQLRRIRNALNRSHHLIDGSGGFGDAGSLHLRIFDHVLHVDAHFVHRAGDFINRRCGLHANFRGFIGSAGHLPGTAGDLRCAVADLPDKVAQSMRHAGEGQGHGVLRGAGQDGHRQLAFRNRRRDGRHVLQVDNHLVEI